METFWTLSVALLGVANLGFLVLLLALTRQVGLILVRLGPTVARETTDSLPVGRQLESVNLADIRGKVHAVQPVKYGQTLLVFVSPACQACRELLSGLRAFASQYSRDVRTLVISTAVANELDVQYSTQLGPTVPYIRDRRFADQLAIKATPYAVLLDAANTIVSKGIVNSLEQVESLLAVEMTVPLLRKTMGVIAQQSAGNE